MELLIQLLCLLGFLNLDLQLLVQLADKLLRRLLSADVLHLLLEPFVFSGNCVCDVQLGLKVFNLVLQQLISELFRVKFRLQRQGYLAHL